MNHLWTKILGLILASTLIIAEERNFEDDLKQIEGQFETLDEGPFIQPPVGQIEGPLVELSDAETFFDEEFRPLSEIDMSDFKLESVEAKNDPELELFGGASLTSSNEGVLSNPGIGSDTAPLFEPLQIAVDERNKIISRVKQTVVYEGRDWHLHCCDWAKMGECRNNGKWMKSFCQKSCGTYGCSESNIDECEAKEIPKCRPAYISNELEANITTVQNEQGPGTDVKLVPGSNPEYERDNNDYIADEFEEEYGVPVVGIRNQKRSQ